MEPVSFCGMGLIALLLIGVVVVGVALLAGGAVMLIARLGHRLDLRREAAERERKTDV